MSTNSVMVASKRAAAALAAAEDEAVREAVRLQEAAGLEGITDGELRRKRGTWTSSPAWAAWPARAHPPGSPDRRARGPARPIFVDAFRFLRSVTTRTAKITIPSPCMLYSQVGRANISRAARHVRVVLGLVSSKVGALESKSDLARRLEEASKFLPLDQLGLSPQCGFSSTLKGNDVSVEQQRAKLRFCAEVAREVWGGL